MHMTMEVKVFWRNINTHSTPNFQVFEYIFNVTPTHAVLNEIF